MNADAGVDFVADLHRQLGLASLSQLGVGETDVPDIIRRAQAASSMKANPIALTDEELADALLEGLA